MLYMAGISRRKVILEMIIESLNEELSSFCKNNNYNDYYEIYGKLRYYEKRLSVYKMIPLLSHFDELRIQLNIISYKSKNEGHICCLKQGQTEISSYIIDLLAENEEIDFILNATDRKPFSDSEHEIHHFIQKFVLEKNEIISKINSGIKLSSEEKERMNKLQYVQEPILLSNVYDANKIFEKEGIDWHRMISRVREQNYNYMLFKGEVFSTIDFPTAQYANGKILPVCLEDELK